MIDTATDGFCWVGMQHEILGFTVVFLVGITIVGLSKAGQKLSDPFGPDEVDLPVCKFVRGALRGTLRILDAAPDLSAPSEFKERHVQVS